MIGLGAKYLTAAGFGRYRITAASLGNLNLLHMLWDWLTAATKQAILGAFGDDGVAVINATNAYLDGIAASDRDKATALAGFINEDPMMVCSLGLEVEGVTMPIRWLKSDGNCYINTGFICDVNTIVDIKFRVNQAHSSRTDIFGTFISTSDGLCIWSQGNNQSVNVNSPSVNYTNYTLVVGKEIDVHIEGRQAVVNGNINNLAGTFYNSAYPAYIYTMDTRGATTGNLVKASVAKLALSKTTEGREMYPFIRKIGGVEKLGMLDVLNDAFYQNIGSGSFTIEYTLPDGTPWTPSTP